MCRAPRARVKSSWSSKTLLLESRGAAETCRGRAVEALTVDDVLPSTSNPFAWDASCCEEEEGEEEMAVSEEVAVAKRGGGRFLGSSVSLSGELGRVVGWRMQVLSRVAAGDRGREGFSRGGSVYGLENAPGVAWTICLTVGGEDGAKLVSR